MLSFDAVGLFIYVTGTNVTMTVAWVHVVLVALVVLAVTGGKQSTLCLSSDWSLTGMFFVNLLTTVHCCGKYLVIRK